MNRQVSSHPQPATLDGFETALLRELRAEVTRVPAVPLVPVARRRRRRLVPALALAGSAVVGSTVWLSTTGSTPAYAVTGTTGGDVTVTVHRLGDAPGLEKALRDRGISADVQFLPWGRACAPGRFTEVASRPATAGPWTMGVSQDGFSMTIPAGGIAPGQTLVLELNGSEQGGLALALQRVAIAVGPVGACTPVAAQVPAAPPGQGQGGTPASGGASADPSATVTRQG